MYILSIDQSTAGTKGLLFTADGRLAARADVPHAQLGGENGWVEHDPMEIYRNTLTAAALVLQQAEAAPEQVAAIGLSNQRETALCWDRGTGLPLYNAIVWQCARATDIVEQVGGLAQTVRERTGLTLSPYFSAAKLGWIVKHIEAAQRARDDGTLCCGTMDSFLLFKLTGAYKTDYSNASRTQLFNLNTLQWDDELARAFGLQAAWLPEICMSDSLFGYTDFEGLFPKPLPVHGVLGDSHAALFANRCTSPFTAKITYGTGSSIMMNTGSSRPAPVEGLSTSLAWGMNGVVDYVLEGNINDTGAVIKWLAQDIGLLSSASEAGAVASEAADTGGVYLVPAFSGLGAPYFNSGARACIIGMNRGTKRAHIVRAAEECIAYQIKDVVELLTPCAEGRLAVLRADGGPTKERFLMQFQADILNMPLEISGIEELSGAGAAYCAGIAAGLCDRAALFAANQTETVHPAMEPDIRDRLYAGWKAAAGMVNTAYNE